jgi:beta-lactamase class A
MPVAWGWIAFSAATESAIEPTHKVNPSAAAFGQLQSQFHATLGVYALDTRTGRTVTFHADQRFAFCSTFKALAAGVRFRRDSNGQLAKVIRYNASELQANSPVTAQHLTTGMTLQALMAAAVEYSDNTAANLMLTQIGGPAGLQRDLRGLGDETTNMDRYEPALNDATPGDPRDTSSPRALATDLRHLVLGNLLTPTRRAELTGELLGNATGGPYIRAGVPSGWKVADKTGNGGYGTRDDIAIVWPPHRPPLIIVLLSHRGGQNSPSEDALLADATRVIVADIA